MFNSIYTAAVTPGQFFLMAGAALVAGILSAWIMSFQVRSSRRFFIVYPPCFEPKKNGTTLR